MEHPIGSLQRYSLRLFLEPNSTPLSPRLITPIFHKWIQQRSVEGLLIDVADYGHLPDGPSTLLVGHDANFAIDGTGGRQGITYSRKRGSNDMPLAERLDSSGKQLISAAVLLETDTSIPARDRFAFSTDEIEFCANDRLLAPAAEKTNVMLSQFAENFGQRLFSAPTEITPVTDGRIGFHLKTAERRPLTELLENLSQDLT